MNGQYHNICRAPAGADTAVLLLHGILSAPQYFDFLMPDIPEHVAVFGVLLDGHGGKPSALGRTSMEIWKAQAESALRMLMQRYQRIIIAAHSMGTLFAVQLAAKYPKKICGMLLLGVPAHVHLTAFGAFGSLLCAGGYPAKPASRLSAMQNAFSFSPDRNPLHYAGWLPRYMELLREIQRVRPLYRRLRVPCAVYQSAHDEFVSQRALKELKGIPHLRLHMLRHSYHFYYRAHDRSRILYTWNSLLGHCGKRNTVPGDRCCE